MITQKTESFLSDWVAEYTLSHQVSEETARMYERSIRIAGNWAGDRLPLAGMCDRRLNSALVAMQEAGRSTDYIRSIKSGVLCVWRDAADAGQCDPPRKIRRLRALVKPPAIWSAEEISKLVIAADTLQGEFRTLPLSRSRWWHTLICAAWDSGLRRRDLHRLTREDCKSEFVWKQNKTQKPVKVRLRQATLAAIDAWGRTDDVPLWPLWGTDNAFLYDWHRIVAGAGIPYGPFKRIRKSAGTAAEQVTPGAGHYMLGNTRAVFERSYLDPMRIETPQPPKLEIG